MEFGQVIEYNQGKIFIQNHAENETGRLVPDLYLFFKKALYEAKARIRKNVFACLFSVHNVIVLSARCEKLYLIKLRFDRCFSHHRAA